MKKLMIALLLLFIVHSSEAQTFNEWFKQKKTQIKYLLNQIAALQVYIELGQKGYKIVDQGLSTIGAIKRGDLNLHTIFFGALKAVNPRIRNAPEVAGIIALQIKIVQTQQKAVGRARRSEQLTPPEIDYIARVYFRLLEQTVDNVEQLLLLITANQYELSDDARIERIKALHHDMQDSYAFARHFDDQTTGLILNRQGELKDVHTMQSLQKIKE